MDKVRRSSEPYSTGVRSFVLVCAFLAGCASVREDKQAPAAGCACDPESSRADAQPVAPAPLNAANNLKPAQWSDLPAWETDTLADAFSAFLRSCHALQSRPQWQTACAGAAALTSRDDASLRQFFESGFTPYAVVNPDGTSEGTMTGYYEPLLRASRQPTEQHRFPVYGVPEDLYVVDFGELYPELKHMRLRGRIDGRRVVPYYSRAEIESGKGAPGRPLVWVDDPVDLFFLQIQGSGKVVLEDGQIMRLSYAEQNGHPYRSIGRLLVERGELALDQASMQGIKAWGARNPDRLPELLNSNASYVFFRERPANTQGPPGSLGVPLTAGRSLAVDPRVIPLGAPVYLSATWPNTTEPLNRLMMAQDTGGAIKGAVRADFFWGSDEEAATQAGRMRQTGRLWVLLPNGWDP